MEDLPLGRIVALLSEFAVKDLSLGRTLMMMMMMMFMMMLVMMGSKLDSFLRKKVFLSLFC